MWRLLKKRINSDNNISKFTGKIFIYTKLHIGLLKKFLSIQKRTLDCTKKNNPYKKSSTIAEKGIMYLKWEVELRKINYSITSGSSKDYTNTLSKAIFIDHVILTNKIILCYYIIES